MEGNDTTPSDEKFDPQPGGESDCEEIHSVLDRFKDELENFAKIDDDKGKKFKPDRKVWDEFLALVGSLSLNEKKQILIKKELDKILRFLLENTEMISKHSRILQMELDEMWKVAKKNDCMMQQYQGIIDFLVKVTRGVKMKQAQDNSSQGDNKGCLWDPLFEFLTSEIEQDTPLGFMIVRLLFKD